MGGEVLPVPTVFPFTVAEPYETSADTFFENVTLIPNQLRLVQVCLKNVLVNSHRSSTIDAMRDQSSLKYMMILKPDKISYQT